MFKYTYVTTCYFSFGKSYRSEMAQNRSNSNDFFIIDDYRSLIAPVIR